MIAKFLDSKLVPMLFLVSAVPCQANGTEPACYPDSNAYMVATYGTEFHEDENLRVSKKTFGKTRFSLVEDLTSGTNHSRVLLRSTGEKKVCVVLATPPVAQLEVVKVDSGGVPQEFKAVDQAPPGMAGTEIRYRLAGDMTYQATCTSVIWRGNKAIRKPIACVAP
jgi:hypothetical protein